MTQPINFSNTNIRCIENTYKKVNPKGLLQEITKFSTKDGKKGTEIITDLGYNQRGVREILRDVDGKAEKVIDRVYGRVETYTNDSHQVIQEAEDGTLTYYPINMWNILTRV